MIIIMVMLMLNYLY